MDTHPITNNRICLLCATALLTLLAVVHTLLLVCYAHTGWQTAAVDAVATTACSATLAYLTWFMARHALHDGSRYYRALAGW